MDEALKKLTPEHSVQLLIFRVSCLKNNDGRQWKESWNHLDF